MFCDKLWADEYNVLQTNTQDSSTTLSGMPATLPPASHDTDDSMTYDGPQGPSSAVSNFLQSVHVTMSFHT